MNMMRWRGCETANWAIRAFTTSPTISASGKLWEAFTAPELPVLLIDEIDKADIEFPNDSVAGTRSDELRRL